MKYVIQFVALALIGALGFYAARTLSPDAISLLFGMSIMSVALIGVSAVILGLGRAGAPTQRRRQINRPIYYVTQDAPADRRQLAQAKRIEVIK